MRKLNYRVSNDWLPFRFWLVQADSEIEARMVVAKKFRCELSELEATLAL
jgi:hypothetical protein